MLPFLKDRHEGSSSGPVEVIERDSDGEDNSDLDMIDAICEDLFTAIEKKDKALLRSVIETLMDEMRYQDELQDE